MSIFYKEGTNKLYYLIGIGIVIPSLILLTYERSIIISILLFLVSVMVWISIFFEYQVIKKQRVADLKTFAKNNNYQFSSKPQSAEINEFKNFKAMQRILLPVHSHSFLNLLIPIETTDSSDINNPKIVTISTTVSAGESSSTYYTQVFLFQMELQIPIFYLAGGKHFFFSNLFRDKNIFGGIKELQEVDIKRFPLVKLLDRLPKYTSLFETVLITTNDYLVFKFLEKKINFQKLIKLIDRISNFKEFQKFKRIKPKNIDDIYEVRDYVSLKLDSLGI